MKIYWEAMSPFFVSTISISGYLFLTSMSSIFWGVQSNPSAINLSHYYLTCSFICISSLILPVSYVNAIKHRHKCIKFLSFIYLFLTLQNVIMCLDAVLNPDNSKWLVIIDGYINRHLGIADTALLLVGYKGWKESRYC